MEAGDSVCPRLCHKAQDKGHQFQEQEKTVSRLQPGAPAHPVLPRPPTQALGWAGDPGGEMVLLGWDGAPGGRTVPPWGWDGAPGGGIVLPLGVGRCSWGRDGAPPWGWDAAPPTHRGLVPHPGWTPCPLSPYTAHSSPVKQLEPHQETESSQLSGQPSAQSR